MDADRPGPNARYRLATVVAPGVRARLQPITTRLVGSVVGVMTSQRVVALTFDDGPHPETTPALLDTLQRHGARATFFMLADRALLYPTIVREVEERGHEVALHGRRHVSLTHASRRVACDVIWGGKRELGAITSKRLRLFRPPHGDLDLGAWALARAAGMEVVHWSADVGDWLDLGLERHLSGAAEVRAGGVMLLHDGDPPPGSSMDRPALLANVLAQLAETRLSSIPVGELLRSGRPVRQFWLSPRSRQRAVTAEA